MVIAIYIYISVCFGTNYDKEDFGVMDQSINDSDDDDDIVGDNDDVVKKN